MTVELITPITSYMYPGNTLEGWAIALIVIGSIICVNTLLSFIIVALWKRNRKLRTAQVLPSTEAIQAPQQQHTVDEHFHSPDDLQKQISQSETIYCSTCGSPNPKGKNYCGDCGESLQKN